MRRTITFFRKARIERLVALHRHVAVIHGALCFSLLFSTVVSIFTSLGLFEFVLVNVRVRFSSIVTVKDLGRNFHLGIIRYKIRGNFNTIYNLDASLCNCLRR